VGRASDASNIRASVVMLDAKGTLDGADSVPGFSASVTTIIG
jgi:hypothetical protein